MDPLLLPRDSVRSLSGFLKAAWKCVISSALQLSQDLLDAAIPYAKSLNLHIHTPWLVGVADGYLLHSPPLSGGKRRWSLAHAQLRAGRVDSVHYHAVPPSYAGFDHCDAIFEACLGH